ncbi:MarR family winged helix-turn-helix transcriptional regulator [Streptomyces xanthii]|uniref:MarR family transcriptional regulator n=1 Tax=Streptomyces xanthii TaxID=2768069 RepID=A0A7H1B1S1_9ACTN|nr:MarR family transcriptional regulator [Streptomyces xanthii]QNS02676.1 MarR family transcriptional regulator [Streptomyces xanthii]
MTDDEVGASDEGELNLGLLMFIPYRFMESAVMDALKSAGHDISLTQARVFQRIGPDGSRLAELAEASQVSKQTIGSIVDQLERAGYVRRAPDPRDARARLVSLTDRGHELVALSLPVVRDVQDRWTAHLGPTRTRQLRQALEALREISDPHR